MSIKDKAIEELNSQDTEQVAHLSHEKDAKIVKPKIIPHKDKPVFDADFNLTDEGQALRKKTYIVNNQLIDIDIKILTKIKRETITRYAMSAVYDSIEINLIYTETIIDDIVDGSIEIINSTEKLTKEDLSILLEFIKNN